MVEFEYNRISDEYQDNNHACEDNDEDEGNEVCDEYEKNEDSGEDDESKLVLQTMLRGDFGNNKNSADENDNAD